jgi:hypothetical protein
MRQVILLLIAFMQLAQMVFGAADMVLGRAPDPIIIGMVSRAIAHYAGDYVEGFSEWFHYDSFGGISLVRTLAPIAELMERAQAHRTARAGW